MKTADLEISKQLSYAINHAGYIFETHSRHQDYKKGLPLTYEDIKKRTPKFHMCELWDMLPYEIYVDKLELGKCWKCINFGFVIYNDGREESRNAVSFEVFKENPCNALANMALWCIEQGHELNLPKK